VSDIIIKNFRSFVERLLSNNFNNWIFI